MKKIYLLLCALVVCGSIFAQTFSPEVGKSYRIYSLDASTSGYLTYVPTLDTRLFYGGYVFAHTVGGTFTHPNGSVNFGTYPLSANAELFVFEETEPSSGVYNIKTVAGSEGGTAKYLLSRAGSWGNPIDLRVAELNSTQPDATLPNSYQWTAAFVKTVDGVDYYTFAANGVYAFFDASTGQIRGYNYNGTPPENIQDNYLFSIIDGDAPVALNVVSTSPVANAANVDVRKTISIIFNAQIASDNLTGITIEDGAAQAVSNIQASITGNVLYITHDDFGNSTTYTVTIPANTITGYESPISFSFTTNSPVVFPEAGKRYNIIHETGKYLAVSGSTVKLADAAPSDPDQIFTFTDAGNEYFNIATTAGFLYSDGSWDAHFKENLENVNNEKMEIAISGSNITIRALSRATSEYLGKNNDNASTIEVYFNKPINLSYWNLVQLPDVTNVSLLSTVPADNAAAILTNTSISASFDILISAEEEDLADITLQDEEGNNVDISVTVAGLKLTIQPAAALSRGKTYTVTIPAGTIEGYADSDDENTAITWTFATLPQQSQQYYIKNVEHNLYVTYEVWSGYSDFLLTELSEEKSRLQIFKLPEVSLVDENDIVNIMLASSEKFLVASSGSDTWYCYLRDDNSTNTAQYQIIRDNESGTVKFKTFRDTYLGTENNNGVFGHKGMNDAINWELIPISAWIGDTDEWNTASNWTSGVVPDDLTKVTIPTVNEEDDGKFYPKLTNEEIKYKTITFEEDARVDIQLNFPSGRWNMLSLPVAATVNDFYFNDDPKTWIRKFAPVGDNANWEYCSSLTTTLDIGEGFIFWQEEEEDEEEGRPVNLSGTLVNEKVETLSFGGDGDYGDSPFALAGNPFLRSIHFDQLVAANPDIITSNYLIWTGTGYTGYTPSGRWGSVPGSVTDSNDRIIAPLQSFIVEQGDDAETNSLTFNFAAVRSDEAGTLKTSASATSKLDIIASNEAGSVLTFIANSGDYQDARKLKNGISNIPDIYTLKEGTALGAQFIQSNYVDIPVGLATDYVGDITLTFNGMDGFDDDTEIFFIDNAINDNQGIEITGLPSYKYTFSYTPAVWDNQITAEENRFAIRFTPANPTGLKQITDPIKVYSKDHSIVATSGSLTPIRQIWLYNAQGNLIYANKNINASSFVVPGNTNLPEVCIVRLVSDNGVQNIKIIK
jgi:hypothetical protein